MEFLRLSYLCDQIRVADNGSHKETVVRNLCAHLHTSCTQVQVHLVVGTWDGSQGKIAHAVELQLESQCRLQVTVDPVLLKLLRNKQDTITNKNILKVFPDKLFSFTSSLPSSPSLTEVVQIGNLKEHRADVIVKKMPVSHTLY